MQPLIFNGTTIESVDNVTFNGVSLDEIIFNGTTIWERVQYDTAWNLCHNGSGSYGTGNTLTISQDAVPVTVSTPRSHAGWAAYLRGVLDNIDGNWWAGTDVNGGNTSWAEDSISFTWDKARWISHIEVQSAASTYYNATPYKWLLQFKYGSVGASWEDNTWVEISGYTAPSQYKTFTVNKQDDRGIYGVKMIAYDHSSYKTGTSSVRANDIKIWAGNLI